jgi:hypothetical protein
VPACAIVCAVAIPAGGRRRSSGPSGRTSSPSAPGSRTAVPPRSVGSPLPPLVSPRGRSPPLGSSPLPLLVAVGSSVAHSYAISLRRAVSRSASRRELAKTIVERFALTRSAMRSSTCGHMEAFRVESAASADSPVSGSDSGGGWPPAGGDVAAGLRESPNSVRSGTGTTT